MADKFTCGWCGHTTAGNPCSSCGRDFLLPWTQRGLEAPVVSGDAGRPALDPATIRAAYNAAHAAIVASGRAPTIDALAEYLDRSPRTVREWRQRFGLE